MTDDWVPLGLESGTPGAYDALHEGVPGWMASSFWSWVRDQISYGEIGSPFRYPSSATLHRIERACRFQIGYSGSQLNEAMQRLKAAASSEDRAIRLADFLLGDPGAPSGVVLRMEQLENVLRESGSAWTVGTRSGRPGLLRRVPEGVQDAADAVTQSGHRAGARLAEAWSAVFGISPDPSRGYSLAIKAVEDAAVPALLPNDTSATLGKVINHLQDVDYKLPFEREHPDATSGTVLKQMCRLLWVGQVDRHGGGEKATGVVSQEAAEAAVVLAVPLVQWFISNQVQRS